MLTERTFDTGEVAINYVEASATGAAADHAARHDRVLAGLRDDASPFLRCAGAWSRRTCAGTDGRGRVAESSTALMDYVSRYRRARLVSLSAWTGRRGRALARRDGRDWARVRGSGRRAGGGAGRPATRLGLGSAGRDAAASTHCSWRSATWLHAGHSAPDLVRILTPQMRDQDGVSIRRRAANLSTLDPDVLTTYH